MFCPISNIKPQFQKKSDICCGIYYYGYGIKYYTVYTMYSNDKTVR